MRTVYIKSSIPYNLIYDILFKLRKKKIIFFIDLQSIAKGFYNKNTIFNEINHYVQNNEPSNILIDEYRDYLNNLYLKFKAFDPFMVTFYDDGHNSQNTSISKAYKGGRSTLKTIIESDDELLLYRKIKQRYYNEVEKKFTILNKGKVYYLKEYESDLIPHYVIKKHLFDSDKMTTLNVIVSNDKDLLQCCQFLNTIQITNTYVPTSTTSKLKIECWDNRNAVTYLYRKFKQGEITSKHIPLILALAGDKADGIKGIKGIGNKKAIDLIQNFSIPFDPIELENNKDNLPTIITNNLKMIQDNLRMISFNEQIKRTNID